MEMHQVRYFLAAVGELNFTKAAERCNVSQPSLTRAIKQLEGELGGDLFRRERPQAQLTDLGQRMLPLLKQCYDSAVGARSLASAIKGGEVGSLRLGPSAPGGVGRPPRAFSQRRGHFAAPASKIRPGAREDLGG